MKSHVDNTQENKSRSIANDPSKKQGSSDFAFQFVDNRPEAITQRKLHAMVNNSPKVRRSAELQRVADNQQTKQLQAFQKKENKTDFLDNLASEAEHISGYSNYTESPGKYLNNEACNTIQKKQQRVNVTAQLKQNINDDPGLEKEADVMGQKALNSGRKKDENRSTLSVGKEASSLSKQLMVAVAGGQATFNKKDFTQLSHLDWAMKISGGPLVDLGAGISSVGVNDDLHLVQHGKKGAMVHQINDTTTWKSIPANTIADYFIKHLPENYAGRIRVSSCFSGTLVDISNQDSSLVKEIKSLILASDRKDLHEVWIVGWDGPTITNINLNSDSGTGAETVDANKVTAAADIQDQLLGGKYSPLKEKWEKNVGGDTRDLDILASAAAKEFEAFYQKFTDLCKHNKLLLDYVDSLVIG